jgi:aspartate kinase
MGIVVQKYGGSSVASPEKIRAVAERVRKTQEMGHQVVVVVSAMGGATDDLLSMARKVARNPERRELDLLLSVGERVSMTLLCMAIRDLGGDAISFTGSQAGIITNDRHVDARIIEVRPFRVQDELERGKIVVVAGYQGVSYKKEVTTLGRGGSDTTAVAMAAALDAEWCEICSDVDGVYTADPRVVPHAKRIESMSHEEMQEMAEAGAKVLNAQAVEFAKQRGIAIYARATHQPPPQGGVLDGTLVRKFAARPPGTVTGVASEKDVLVLKASGCGVDLLAALDKLEVCGKQLHLTLEEELRGSIVMLLSRINLHNESELRNALEQSFCERVRLVDGLGAVSVIGAGINNSYANMRKGWSALEDIPIAGMSTSSFRITWLVPSMQVEEAVRRLHAAFLEDSAEEVPAE